MSTKSNNTQSRINTSRKLTHERAPGMPLADLMLLVILGVTACLMPMAMFAMGEESGPAASFKYLLTGLAAAGAAFGVNKFALDRLAPLHATGFRLAGAIAIVFILLTGTGTALGSFTAIVFKSVEAKTYQTSANELSTFIAEANEVALIAERIAPSVDGISEDIARTASCEVAASCLSQRSGGGRGPMSRALDIAAGHAGGIADALRAGAQERDQLLDDLNRLNTAFVETLADRTRSVAERRAELQVIHAEVRQVTSALVEALPMAAVRGYAETLRASATVAGDPRGSRVLSTYLRSHGDALEDQLKDLPEAELTAPSFPARPGMIEVLKAIPIYLAIAAIVIVGELCLPITMYMMTYIRHAWEIEQEEHDRLISENRDDT